LHLIGGAAEEGAMMGRQNAQEKLFYQFRLEDHVPPDHLLRQLDSVLNFDQARTVLARHYSPLAGCGKTPDSHKSFLFR
jgi:hypothetical protein